MQLVGHHDLQGRSAYQPTLHRYGERSILFVGHHAGEALNSQSGGWRETECPFWTSPIPPLQSSFITRRQRERKPTARSTSRSVTEARSRVAIRARPTGSHQRPDQPRAHRSGPGYRGSAVKRDRRRASRHKNGIPHLSHRALPHSRLRLRAGAGRPDCVHSSHRHRRHRRSGASRPERAGAGGADHRHREPDQSTRSLSTRAKWMRLESS